MPMWSPSLGLGDATDQEVAIQTAAHVGHKGENVVAAVHRNEADAHDAVGKHLGEEELAATLQEVHPSTLSA